METHWVQAFRRHSLPGRMPPLPLQSTMCSSAHRSWRALSRAPSLLYLPLCPLFTFWCPPPTFPSQGPSVQLGETKSLSGCLLPKRLHSPWPIDGGKGCRGRPYRVAGTFSPLVTVPEIPLLELQPSRTAASDMRTRFPCCSRGFGCPS